MESIDFIDESTRKTIINELSRSLDGLGIDIEAIVLDINAEAVNLMISICNNKLY